jgi:neurotransmitter:Na+ symporter, NSS family
MAENVMRETLKSRLGFLLLAAGCAVGLGNVWRFPFIAGLYGGASFVMIYLLFLVILGLPIMIMELSVGRGARQNIGKAFRTLEPEGTKWHIYGHIGIAGNYLLMAFYTTVTGWILSYLFATFRGQLTGLTPVETERFFGSMLVDPLSMGGWMVAAVVIGFLVTSIGLQKGVERVSKFMMLSLLFLMLALAVKAMTLEGAAEGLRFYLMPDFERFLADGPAPVIFAAMGQAFFTLSLGMGGMAIFGSYIGKERSLPGESVRIVGLDASVAIMSGLIIFPATFAFGMSPEAGPGLIFVILPNIFNQMAGGQFWGTIFFLFMSFAALSTVIGAFENIVSYWIDVWGWDRARASWINCGALILLSVPTVLGFNAWSGFEPLGPGTTVLELKDMIVSTTLLPIGALVFLFFTTSRYGWGWNNFLAEANTGRGLKLAAWSRFYISWILPLIIIVVFVRGYWDLFGG